MSMPSPTGRNWPEAMRALELRRRARVIANFAEYLAGDVRGHPERAVEAMGALAEWCEGDHELMVQARTEVLRPTQGAGERPREQPARRPVVGARRQRVVAQGLSSNSTIDVLGSLESRTSQGVWPPIWGPVALSCSAGGADSWTCEDVLLQGRRARGRLVVVPARPRRLRLVRAIGRRDRAHHAHRP